MDKKKGRPTKYTPELIAKVKEYLTTWEEQGDEIPSHAGLALHINIRRSTLYKWQKDEDKVEFSDTLDQIMLIQQKVLLNKGLNGEHNASIVKLMLANHGYSGKQQIEHSGSTVTEIISTIVDPKDMSA